MGNYGLDYGTTTSLLYKYVKRNDLKRVVNKLSMVKVSNGNVIATGQDAMRDENIGCLVESPKREFVQNREKSVNGVSYSVMIEHTILSMLQEESVNLQNSHITLTVPNGYIGADCMAMCDIVRNALNKMEHELKLGHKLNVEIHFLPEPVAAALYYVYCVAGGDFENSHFIVCDIGGGTTDMSIVSCTRNNNGLVFRVEEGQVYAHNLGGNDFDKRILGRMGFRDDFRGRNQAKYIKHQLSTNEICDGYYRDDFIGDIGRELERLRGLMVEVEQKKRNIGGDDWAILRVGGSCRIPAIQELMKNVWGVGKQFDAEGDDIFYSVAQGAAIYSAFKSGQLDQNGYANIDIEGRAPHEIRFKTSRGEWTVIVPQNSRDGEHKRRVRLDSNRRVDKNGRYSVGDVIIKENDREYQWPRRNQGSFSLNGRKIEDVRLTLCIKTKNGRPFECSITDDQTKECDTWSINPNH